MLFADSNGLSRSDGFSQKAVVGVRVVQPVNSFLKLKSQCCFAGAMRPHDLAVAVLLDKFFGEPIERLIVPADKA